MLHFYPSNYTENLATVVAQIMKVKPLANPFSEELILIQSHGMGQWLQQQISQELGIAAMINTMMPASFVWKLAEKLLPDDQVIPLFEKQNLRWQLMKILPAKLSEPAYQPLANYLNAQKVTDELPEQVVYQLCDSVADLFDAYQNYRSDWLELWEKGDRVFQQEQADSLLASTENWQRDLWQSVYESIDLDARRHRPMVLHKLSQVLSHPDIDIRSLLPERLFVFGLSALPPQWLPVFELLSRHTEIHFLVFNPCQQYWGDIQSEPQQLALQKRLIEQGISPETAAESVYEANPLLASWGRLGRDYVALLSKNAAVSEIPVDLFENPGDGKALHSVQQDILNLQGNAHKVRLSDKSIQFAHCHSRLREVEALHDHLFSLLDQQPDISPKDVIVMMPDVQTFAPLIEAVFSRPARDENNQYQSLPYAISDQMLAMDQPLIDVIVGLLNLNSLRVSAKEVVDWLDIEAIRSRLGIEEQELAVVYHWIESLSVRWGISEVHRDQVLEMRHSGQGNTWLNAFRRLLAGIFYSADGTPIICEDASGKVLPFNLSDREQQALAGKLMRFLDVIETSRERMTGRNTVERWLEIVSDVWLQWFDDQVLHEDVQRLMDNALTKTQEQVLFAEFAEEVNFDVVADALLTHFQKERVSQRFLAGRINFCTLMPMRSIPFKAVCLIGMNEGQYPRQENKSSFDLMAMSPARIGDRSRRSDDRYLFLEALCSAREFLYISYCAYDARDNSEQFPSILVSELRDYCDKYFEIEGGEHSARSCVDQWTIDHRLQPFHPDYFRESSEQESPPRSYCEDWLALHHFASVDELESQELNLPEKDSAREIVLDELVSCANHPLRYFYQNELGVRFFGSESEIEDVEPFALTSLEMHRLKQDLAEAWFDDDREESSVLEEWRFDDRLPRPPAADLYLGSVQQPMKELKSSLASTLPIEEKKLSLVCHDVLIEGEILVARQGQFTLSLSKHIGGQFFGFWVKHVVWNAYLANSDLNCAGNSVLLTPEACYLMAAIAPERAIEYLGQILNGYQTACSEPIPFLPKTAFAQLFESPAKALTAFKGWRSPTGDIAGEGSDPYWERACLLGSLANDATEIPSFESVCLYQQVREQLEEESIQIKPMKQFVSEGF